jgi:hypothetical protein
MLPLEGRSPEAFARSVNAHDPNCSTPRSRHQTPRRSRRGTVGRLGRLGRLEISGYERRCLTWVAAWETHMVATLADPSVLRRRRRGGREPNCNDNCNDADREHAS